MGKIRNVEIDFLRSILNASILIFLYCSLVFGIYPFWKRGRRTPTFIVGLVEMSTVLQGTVGHVMRLELNLLQQFVPPMKENDSYWKNQQFTKMLVRMTAIVAQ